jgi:hypothetical protein
MADRWQLCESLCVLTSLCPLCRSLPLNQHNNFFLPGYNDRKGKFASKDANYIGTPLDMKKLLDY